MGGWGGGIGDVLLFGSSGDSIRSQFTSSSNCFCEVGLNIDFILSPSSRLTEVCSVLWMVTSLKHL